MHTRKLLKALAVLTLTALPLSFSHAQEQHINLKVTKEGPFEVLFHRAKSNAVGAAVAGLIGAGIQEGILKSKDEKMRDQLLPLLSETSCSKMFTEEFFSKLERKGFSFSDQADATVEVKINRCGFKMVNTQTEEIAAFVDYDSVISSGTEKGIKEQHLIFGKKRYQFQELLSSELLPEREFFSVLKKGGRFIANKVIYKKD